MINRDGTKKILKTSFISIIVLIVIGYAVFASRSFISGPKIVIYEPISGSTISTSTVMIKGVALRIQDISINGRPITVDKEGDFNEILQLAPGYNIALLSAKDKFGRTIEYRLELVYK